MSFTITRKFFRPWKAWNAKRLQWTRSRDVNSRRTKRHASQVGRLFHSGIHSERAINRRQVRRDTRANWIFSRAVRGITELHCSHDGQSSSRERRIRRKNIRRSMHPGENNRMHSRYARPGRTPGALSCLTRLVDLLSFRHFRVFSFLAPFYFPRRAFVHTFPRYGREVPETKGTVFVIRWRTPRHQVFSLFFSFLTVRHSMNVSITCAGTDCGP